MADASGSKPRKSTLQGLLSGESFPLPPTFNSSWDLKGYNSEWQKWVRKLDDYVRRLMGQFTGENIVNEIIGGSTSTTNVFTQGFVGAFREGQELVLVKANGETIRINICDCPGCYCEHYYQTDDATVENGISIGTFLAGTYCYKYISGAFNADGSFYARATLRLGEPDHTIIVQMYNDFLTGHTTVEEAEAETDSQHEGTFTLDDDTELFITVGDIPGEFEDNHNDGTPVKYRICKIS